MHTSRKHKTELPTRLPIHFFFEKHTKSQNRLLICLHGYQDSAASFLKRAISDSKPEYDFLAPDGPFPVPVRTEDGFKEAYSWYFEEHSMGRIVIPKSLTVELLVNLIKELKLEDHQKTIVGFSQGGFLAPKLAEQISHVEKIIGIGCMYRKESYEKIKHIKVYGIHGTEDSIVDYEEAAQTFKALSLNGIEGEFLSIQDMGHTICDAAQAALIDFISR